jgi:OmpA-OmpF porin, OOP family
MKSNKYQNTMKNVVILLICLFIGARVCAQVSNPGDVAKSGATDHANNDVSNTVDNGLNKTEDAIKGLFKKKKKPAKTDTTATVKPVQQQQQTGNGGSGSNSGSNSNGAAGSIAVYQNFDFVAGDKIIFSDDFQADQNGEFPAHWVLEKGQAVMNNQAGKNSLLLTDGNYVIVGPRMSNRSYLGNEFTIEFDTYMGNTSTYPMMVFFRLPNNESDADASITLNKTEVSFDNTIEGANSHSFSGNLPAAIADDIYLAKWHHIAIGYKNNQLKIYVDQYRVLSVPDAKIAPGSITFGGLGAQDAPLIFSNVKVAQGGSQNMIGNILTNGKFITHGITFDIDKATIKPESMGVLNEVASFLKSNASVKMEIDGHTDNTGASAHNLQLSQQRADAVKSQLVSMGIDASRFTTKGLGDTKPINNNQTPEGRADNRRVEFVKI